MRMGAINRQRASRASAKPGGGETFDVFQEWQGGRVPDGGTERGRSSSRPGGPDLAEPCWTR